MGLQIITFRARKKNSFQRPGLSLLEVQAKESEIPGELRDRVVGTLLSVGPFAGPTASICIMGTEGFDGNGKRGNEEPPDRVGMRPQNHAWTKNRGLTACDNQIVCGFSFRRSTGGNCSCLHANSKHGVPSKWKRQKPQG